MLIIRLQRTGRKHEPTFRVVLTDSKNGPKSGKYLKNLGWYDTRIKNKLEQLDIETINRCGRIPDDCTGCLKSF